MIKGLLLDYGGTIDSDGVHWGELLWTMYERHHVPVSKAAFRDAYVFGEKALALHPHVQPQHDFHDVLRIKLRQQFNYLESHGHLSEKENGDAKIEAIAADCDAYARDCVAKAIPVLEALAARYPVVLVSNFYGNVNAVLDAYGIRHFFGAVIESSVVGVRKPSPEIFAMGVRALGFLPGECAAVGDSYRKDMVPAKAAGCHTVWLKGEGWEDDPAEPVAADKTIAHFAELLPLFLMPSAEEGIRR